MTESQDHLSEYFIVQQHESVAVVRFEARVMLDSATIHEVAGDLHALLDEHHLTKLVLDFTNVKFLASHALGMLIDLRRKAGQMGGNIVLAGLIPDIGRVFRITKLDRWFEFYESADHALQAFS